MMFSRTMSALGIPAKVLGYTQCIQDEVARTNRRRKEVRAVWHVNGETALPDRMADVRRRGRTVHDPCEHGRDPLVLRLRFQRFRLRQSCQKRMLQCQRRARISPGAGRSPPIDLSQLRLPVFGKRGHALAVARGNGNVDSAARSLLLVEQHFRLQNNGPRPGAYRGQNRFRDVGIGIGNQD